MKLYIYLYLFFYSASPTLPWFLANKLSSDLIEFVNNVTNFLPMQEEFERTKGEFVEVNSTLLIDEFVDNIETMFRKKREMVKRLKRNAEQFYVPYEEGSLRYFYRNWLGVT